MPEINRPGRYPYAYAATGTDAAGRRFREDGVVYAHGPDFPSQAFELAREDVLRRRPGAALDDDSDEYVSYPTLRDANDLFYARVCERRDRIK